MTICCYLASCVNIQLFLVKFVGQMEETGTICFYLASCVNIQLFLVKFVGPMEEIGRNSGTSLCIEENGGKFSIKPGTFCFVYHTNHIICAIFWGKKHFLYEACAIVHV